MFALRAGWYHATRGAPDGLGSQHGYACMSAPSEVAPGAWVRSPRFEVRDVLGVGASCVVLCAFDHERSEEVALKVARERSPKALRDLRREFEILKSLSHCSFVSAAELFEGEERPFFSMEKIDGLDLVHYVCGHGQFDEDKLRAAFAQLTRALRVLHRRGRVHRDVKPGNVRVTAGGRLVLLDLGLCADIDALEKRPHEGPVGTAHYMAPEQAAGDVSPASDLYAVGALLFRCLSGFCPFEGPAEQVLLQKHSEAPPPLPLGLAIPADLERLCAALMLRDPLQRPSAGQILQVLEMGREASHASSSSSSSFLIGAVPLVGREAELARVVGLCTQGEPHGKVVWINGTTGIGKTAFLRACVERIAVAEGDATWTFLDRCEPRPWLPYQGVSVILTGLAARLRAEPQEFVERIMPRDGHCLVDAFPAFKRVSAFALHEEGARIPDPVERRWRALLALRGLICELGKHRRLVFAIDDFHWADGDTLQVVAALTEPERDSVPRPAVSFLMTGAANANAPVRSPTMALELGTLPFEDVGALADELLDPRAVESVLSRVDLVGPRAEPRLVVEALRQAIFFGPESVSASSTLDEIYRRRIGSLDATSTRALEACAVAGQPLLLAELAIVSDLEPSQLGRALGMLRALGLVVDSMLRGDLAVEIPGLPLRAAILSLLTKERSSELSLRLVAAAQSVDQRVNAMLLSYQLGSGHLEAARRTAALAARGAEDVMAFEHAVHVYELASAAWEGQPDDLQRTVFRAMGEALACAGYSARAAESFSRASEGARSADSLEMRRRAAEYWLRSGHIEEALAALVRLLSEVSVTLPKRGRRALMSMLWQRAALTLRGLEFTRKTPRQLSARDLTTVDIFASVGSLLGLVDFVSGADFQTRAVREALHTGEPYRVARALCVEATFASATEKAPRFRAKRMVEVASRLAEQLDEPYLRGMVWVGRASIELTESQFERSASSSMQAERLFRECCTGVTWEIGQAQYMALMALMHRGALRELSTCAQRYEREALERGDLYGWTHILTVGGFMTPLIANKPKEALDLVSQAMARWPRDFFHLQHFVELMALVQVDLYIGGTAALMRLEAVWPELKRSMLLGVPMIGASASWMLGAALLTAYTTEPEKYPDAPKRVRSLATELGKAESSHYIVLMRLLEAQVAMLEGNLERARALADDARRAVARFGFGLFAERVEYMCGVLTPGAHGAAMKKSALEALRAQGVVDPLRYIVHALPVLGAQ